MIVDTLGSEARLLVFKSQLCYIITVISGKLLNVSISTFPHLYQGFYSDHTHFTKLLNMCEALSTVSGS